jgi:hypothetical protein
MATTTNYGWTTPDDTDLVKNGADAIRVLGASIDTSMNTALGTKKAGMVLLNTTSFSAVASQSFNNVFSATYKDYVIVGNLAQSVATANLTIRLRVGGTDNTTSDYAHGTIISATTGTVTSTITSSANLWTVSENRGVANRNIFWKIGNPFESSVTELSGTLGVNRFPHINSAIFNASTSFDGFSIFPSTGNITGQIKILGVSE